MGAGRVCRQPGCPALATYRGGCPTHPPKRGPSDTGRTWTERQRRAAVVEQWRTRHGDWCPGWQRPGHPSSDLTADHVLAVGAGGSQHGDLTVLCRACNGAKAARTDDSPPGDAPVIMVRASVDREASRGPEHLKSLSYPLEVPDGQ